MMGSDSISWTAVGAVACYGGRILIDVTGLKGESWQRRGRDLWSLGAVFLLLHVVAAFHFQHGWSHWSAWEHTRRRTLEQIGWNEGSGLYANYATTLIWLADAIGWWIRLDWPRRFRGWFWSVQLVLAFMMLNATAVFGPQYWIPLAAGYVTLLGIVTLARWLLRSES